MNGRRPLTEGEVVKLKRIGSVLSGFCFVGFHPYDKAISAHLRKNKKKR